MRITAEFVTSAIRTFDLPGAPLPEIALVGRSNVGKSSLINALVRRRLARTSAAPGKTRLANIYRVSRGSVGPVYLVDLPGYGYARGGPEAALEFQELTAAYFERVRLKAAYFDRVRLKADTTSVRSVRLQPDLVSALLFVDARHPGLESDLAAWRWLGEWVASRALVATKIDKLGRGRRIRALRELESVFVHSVLPVSAITGEGLDELWNLIDTLANSRNPLPRRRNRSSRPPQKAMEPRPPSKVEGPKR